MKEQISNGHADKDDIKIIPPNPRFSTAMIWPFNTMSVIWPQDHLRIEDVAATRETTRVKVDLIFVIMNDWMEALVPSGQTSGDLWKHLTTMASYKCRKWMASPQANEIKCNSCNVQRATTLEPTCKVSVLSNENWPYKRADHTSEQLRAPPRASRRPRPATIQGGWGGWPTGNGKKLSCCQAQLGQATCLAVA